MRNTVLTEYSIFEFVEILSFNTYSIVGNHFVLSLFLVRIQTVRMKKRLDRAEVDFSYLPSWEASAFIGAALSCERSSKLCKFKRLDNDKLKKSWSRQC